MRIMLFSLLFCFFITGCTKVPEKVDAVTVRIFSEIQNDREYFLVQCKGEIKNENSCTALVDVKGKIILHDPSMGKYAAAVMPFEIPVILPFSDGMINSVKKMNEKEVMPLVELLGLDREGFLAHKNTEDIQLNKKYVQFQLDSYGTRDIIELLKERINEKNQ